ncbi:MAG: acyl-CoA dehydrogenase family protein [Actinobacteria bacterium]|nr:acyl-CoA dehydrogenase family protein [Actinomycetota bacterium]MBU4301977.1 acyl-CoA dehydrogenase family protein [Actinomycetota bacterium]MBU4386244.1 acyl-CoA dehydrogenase family protein [Actinomycetota bacterium]MBU4490610.1 acyl-CoA dehydrogenase family protein [Actinomycetota bacterium]MCG2794845.1 acyl-CoA dehydrogenase family protein [Actinomycetes bacterium]
MPEPIEMETAFQVLPEVEELRLRVRKIVRRDLAPFSREIEETDSIPGEVAGIVRDSGLHGLQVPVGYGGMGLGMLAACVITEEIAWLSQALVRFVGGDALGISILGSELLCEKYLGRIASGELLAAFALTEREAGSDALSIQCRARRDGDRYLLTGEKVMVTCGDIAGLVLVFAVTDPDAGGGVTAFVVENTFPGFEVVRAEPKMGLRGVHTAHLAFHDCPVPAENILDEEGNGFVVAMRLLDLGRIRYNGAASVGNSQRLLEMSVHHARERKQFGKRIGNFEGVGFMLARMAVQTHAARLMVYNVAARADRMEPVTLESAMVKLFATEALDGVADMAVQVHGGQGYLKDLEVERFYRDARAGRIWDGTSEIQQLIIARTILDG